MVIKIISTCGEVFTELVGSALKGKCIDPLIESHVVEVLCAGVHATYIDPRSFRIEDMLRFGLDAQGYTRNVYLRITGDMALFVSGIFPDSFYAKSRRTEYDLGHYIDIGRKAYDNTESEILKDLSDNFPQIVEALNDLSIKLKLTSHDVQKYADRRRLIDARTTRR